jgi:SET domain-containing protein
LNHLPHLAVRNSALHGRGLFALEPIAEGTVLGVYPLLILSAEDTETLKSTRLYHYVFYVDEDAAGRVRAAIGFGLISMCNHSPEANTVFEVDPLRQEVTLTASRPISADEEVLIDYEDFAEQAI